MSAPKLSIILPIFEVEDYIQECVASIRAQTLTDFEVICVNDATLDNAIPLLKRAIDGDKRFRIVHNDKNRGLGGARNAGLDLARGEFIQFVDSDDALRPNMCQKLVDLAEKNEVDWAVCSSLMTGQNLLEYLEDRAKNTFASEEDAPVVSFIPPYHTAYARQMAQSGVVDLSESRSVLFDVWPSMWLGVRRRSVIGDLRFDENLYYEDHRFHFEFGQKAKSFVATEEPLYLYRTHGAQITKDNSSRCLEIFPVLNSVRKLVADDPKLQGDDRAYARYLTRVLLERFVGLDLDTELSRQFREEAREVIADIWVKAGVPEGERQDLVDALRPEWADKRYARYLLLGVEPTKYEKVTKYSRTSRKLSKALKKLKDRRLRRRRRLVSELSAQILVDTGQSSATEKPRGIGAQEDFHHMVLMNWFLAHGAGGPPGYLANLRRGLDLRTDETSHPIYIQRLTKKSADYEPEYGPEDLTRLVEWFANTDNLTLPEAAKDKIKLLSPRSIHTHICTDMVGTYNHFDREGLPRPLTIFSSHAPESWGKEVADIWRSKGHSGSEVEQLERVARLIEAKAFREADVWVFPSAEAMEPYYATIPRFGEWAAHKDIRFVRTGSPAKPCEMDQDAAKESFGLSGQRVISFIGRHIEAKGYDLMKEIGAALLEEFEDLTVLVAGKEDGLPALDHPRWKELGWFNKPEQVIRASDVFVLPNKNTYFDLVLLEALSLSAPVVASATGGNKTVAADTDGAIELAEPTGQALAAKVRELLIDDNRRRALGDKARSAYDVHYTELAFAENYTRLVEEIQKDYGLAVMPSET